MMYLLHGTEPLLKQARVEEISQEALRKNTAAQVFRMRADDFSESQLREYLTNTGLFQAENVIVLRDLFADKNTRDAITAMVSEMENISHAVIFVEDSATKKTLGLLKKAGAAIEEFGSTGKGAVPQHKEFNVFSLTDALGNRDRKRLWVLYQQAQIAGLAPEEVHGVLVWQVRNMLLVADAPNKNPGLHPFVFQKVGKAVKKYSPRELYMMSSKLVSIMQDARSSGTELAIGLEKFILK